MAVLILDPNGIVPILTDVIAVVAGIWGSMGFLLDWEPREDVRRERMKRWLDYWVVYASVSTVENVVGRENVVRLVPIWRVVKAGVVVWTLLDGAGPAASGISEEKDTKSEEIVEEKDRKQHPLVRSSLSKPAKADVSQKLRTKSTSRSRSKTVGKPERPEPAGGVTKTQANMLPDALAPEILPINAEIARMNETTTREARDSSILDSPPDSSPFTLSAKLDSGNSQNDPGGAGLLVDLPEAIVHHHTRKVQPLSHKVRREGEGKMSMEELLERVDGEDGLVEITEDDVSRTIERGFGTQR